jgi:Domain of unknown function (DUF4412)
MPRRSNRPARLLLILLAALPLGLCRPTPAAADLLLAIKGHADGFRIGGQVQEPRDSEAKIWFTTDRMRRDEGSLTVLVRQDRRKLYLINHTDRTYSELDLPVDWKKMVPPGDQDSFSRYLEDNQIKAAVHPGTETRKIHDWSAHRVDVELSNQHGLKMSTQMWLTKDLPLYQAYNQMSGTLASLRANAVDWSQKVSQLDGLPVYQETVVSVGPTSAKSREELVSATTVQPPAGTYDVPKGFTAVPYDPFRPPETE